MCTTLFYYTCVYIYSLLNSCGYWTLNKYYYYYYYYYSISNGIKTIENISEFKTLFKKWNGSPCICKNCIICTISYM